MPDTGYALFAVFRREHAVPVADVTALGAVIADAAESGVTLRGVYDVSGMRADADLMFWLHGEVPEAVQAAFRAIRRAPPIAALSTSWSAMGVHRDAEFNRAHVPGFLRGEPARRWLTVYPFVRSYDWYVLPADERSRMLAEHGRKGAAFTTVVANTVSAFALGDYEWLLPMESDELTDLVDMMRDLRGTDARLHVREEVPFFTGRRVELDEIPEVLA